VKVLSLCVFIQVDAKGSVISASASGARKLLQRTAKQNLQGWTFHPRPVAGGGSSTRLTITFIYRLEGKEEYCDPPSRVVLDLPSSVQITTNPTEPQP
jgi:TonB family protein